MRFFCPAVSCAKLRTRSAHENRYRRAIRIPCALAFRYAVLSPATNSLVTVVKRMRLIKPVSGLTSPPSNLNTSNGLDHTVCRTRQRRSSLRAFDRARVTSHEITSLLTLSRPPHPVPLS